MADKNSILKDYQKDNEIRKQQFEILRKDLLLLAGFDPQDPDLLTLTGSRKSGLAYYESDFDCAFIGEDFGDLDKKRNQLIAVADKFPKEWNFKNITTKTGLPWVPISNVVFGAETPNPLITKLDVTFRLRKIHDQIQNHVEKQLPIQFPTDESKLQYIMEIEKAFHSNDMERYQNLKSWLKVL